MSQSVWFRQSVSAPKRTIEYFLAASAGAKLTAYNATLNDNELSDLFETKRVVGTFSLSAHLTYQRVAATYEYVYSRGEIKNQTDHRYGRLALIYRF